MKLFVIIGTCKSKAYEFILQQYSSNLQQFKFTHFGGFLIDKVEGEVKRGQKLVSIDGKCISLFEGHALLYFNFKKLKMGSSSQQANKCI